MGTTPLWFVPGTGSLKRPRRACVLWRAQVVVPNLLDARVFGHLVCARGGSGGPPVLANPDHHRYNPPTVSARLIGRAAAFPERPLHGRKLA